MKTYKNLYEKIYAFENLHRAYVQSRSCKRYRAEILEFSHNLEGNLLEIQQDLRNQTYQHGPYREFVVWEAKRRVIKAAPFRDRVVHHALCNIIEPLFDKGFIDQSYACRKGKGTHKAIKKLQSYLRATREKAYCLQGDISKYFSSINHQILLSLLNKKIADKKTMWLIEKIINSSFDQPLAGIPIGNLTSQLFANIYLNELDQLMKHQLKEKYYLRYMDDFLIFGFSKKPLFKLKEMLKNFLADKLKLTMPPNKVNIFPGKAGVDFLGYKIFCNRKLLRKSTVKRFIKRVILQKEKMAEGIMTKIKFHQGLESWKAYARFGNSWKLRYKLALSCGLKVLLVLIFAFSFLSYFPGKAYASAGYITGKFKGAYNFSGNFYMDAGNVGTGIQTASFWINGTAAGKILDFNGSAYISASGGTISLTGFTGTIYVDGAAGTTIDSSWHFVVVTTATGINASSVKIGSIDAGNLNGSMDDIKFYNYSLSTREIAEKYRQGSPSLALGGTMDGSLYLMSSGYLGIGTTSPTSMLSAGDSSQFQVNSTGNIVKINNVTTSFPSSQGAANSVLTNDGAGTLTWNNPLGGSGTLGFWQRTLGSLAPTNITDSLNLGAIATSSALIHLAGTSGENSWINTGNIGIGTTSPLARLGVVGTDVLNTSFAANIGGLTGTGLVVTNAGNVGIGTTGPLAKLDINGSAWLRGVAGGTGGLFATTGGNIGIGTTAPVNALTISGNANITGNLGIGNTAPTSMLFVQGAVIGKALVVFDETGDQALLTASASGVTKFLVDHSGNVGIGTTNPARKLEVVGDMRLGTLLTGAGSAVYWGANGDLVDSASSLRFKDNIADFGPVLDKLNRLRPVKFTWNQNSNSPGIADFGLIAEEVNQTLPDLVIYEKDQQTPYGIKYEKLGLLAISGLQEQELKLDQIGDIISTQNLTISEGSAEISQTREILTLLTRDIDSLKSESASTSAQLAALKEEIANFNVILGSPAEGGTTPGSTDSGQDPGQARTTARMTDMPLFTAETATVSGSLMVLGKTTMNDVGITGKVTMGLLTIDGLSPTPGESTSNTPGVTGTGSPGVDETGANISTLSGPLKLQDLALGNLEIMAGKVTVDTKGNVKIAEGDLTLLKGKVSAPNIEAEEFQVLGAKSAGSATFPAGETSLEIEAEAASESAKILLTPNTISRQILTVSKKETGKFTVEVKEAEEFEIKFDWFIIGN